MPSLHITPSTVHPHARGEHALAFHQFAGLFGSSPRPWGTPAAPSYASNRCRFIPTPVGNTAFSPAVRRATAVHPHARGEHAPRRTRADDPPGSSPRPWGTLDQINVMAGRLRFIPTPVGNTCHTHRKQRVTSVHPHARGEHINQCGEILAFNGSSPRPWGTPRHAEARYANVRFIPTPVGNTSPYSRGK